jgi:hypothetical protein
VNIRASTSVGPDLHFLTLCTYLAEKGISNLSNDGCDFLLSAAYFKH